MKEVFVNYLFNKGYFVENKNGSSQNAYSACFSLANLFGIKIVNGANLADISHVEIASDLLAIDVPEPFYRNFPESVKSLTSEEKLFDQLLSYYQTYYLGDFTKSQHSVMESEFERLAFTEAYEIKTFSILTEKEAYDVLQTSASDLTKSSRPLNLAQFEFLSEFMETYGFMPQTFTSTDTVIRLLIATREPKFFDHLYLSDVLKVVEYIVHYDYYDFDLKTKKSLSLKKLNLKHKDRKFITALLDYLFTRPEKVNVKICYERKALWCGLLHHIHYYPKCQAAKDFLCAMRGKKNHSILSGFEKLLASGDTVAAADLIIKEKGQGAFMRNLTYILSRTVEKEQALKIIDKIDLSRPLIAIQLLLSLSTKNSQDARIFKFTKFCKMNYHMETLTEVTSRKSIISKDIVDAVCIHLKDVIKKHYESKKLGKIYIDQGMKNIALPIQETTSFSGVGVLPKGSKIDIDLSKKLRFFTYWEKVNDIDLSLLALNGNSLVEEFSWRTMSATKNMGLTFSGDQTAGYEGGSEYFDFELKTFRKNYPNATHLVLVDNVYSKATFADCICRAGYMVREKADSGKVFEPKTVQTSFTVNADAPYAVLFAVDLEKSQLIWLNLALQSGANVAAYENLSFVTDYFKVTDVINMYDLFAMCAEEVLSSPTNADVIVSDNQADHDNEAEIIRSCDFDKVMKLLNE